MSGPFSYLGGSIDAALNAYVISTVSSMAASLEAPLLAAITLSLTVRGFAILRGTRPFSVIDSALDLAWQAGHLGLALSASTYLTNVVSFADGAANTLIGVFSRQTSATSYQVLDQLESQGATIADHYVALGVSAFPTGGYIDLLSGLLMGAVIAILLIILGGYFLVTKVALALVLSFGPLFIAANAFKLTQHWFSNWLNKALRVVFAPNELRDAREISETLGVNTLYAIQESHSKSRMSSRRSITERRVEQARPLMLPQELRTLPPDQQLLLLHGSAPILAEKLRYYEDPVLKARADVDLA